MSRAAYDLQVPRHSPLRILRPPRVRARRLLEHLDGLGIETTITAAGLCAIGTGSASTAATTSGVGSRRNMPRQDTPGRKARIRAPSPPERDTRSRSRPTWPSRWCCTPVAGAYSPRRRLKNHSWARLALGSGGLTPRHQRPVLITPWRKGSCVI